LKNLFPKELLDRIITDSRVEDIVSDFIQLKPKGADLVGECPKCRKAGKLSVNKAKQVVKCFSCGDKGYGQKTVIKLVQHLKGCDFKEAVLWLTDKYNLHHLLPSADVTIDVGAKPPKTKKTAVIPRNEESNPKETTTPPEPKAAKPTSVRTKPKVDGSFRDQTLAESGITDAMQRMNILRTERGQDSTITDFDRYETGTLNMKKGGAIERGNVDMIMHYVGLDRKAMTFVPKQGNKSPKPMLRCRFERPELHMFKGKPTKYVSPKDSGLHLWLPNKLITDFNNTGVSAGILTFQEGEKKADRMCQIAPSVGIMGIHSLAKMDDHLPGEVEQLQKKFDFDTYIFFMDADLFELGNSKDGSVDQRPKSFANAAKKFRHHIHKFQSGEKRLTILLAHPTTLDQDIKGMDDLMESGLVTDEEMRTILANGAKGIDHELVKFYELTIRTDEQIDDIWNLAARLKFAEEYRDKIRAIFGEEKFKLGRQWRKFDKHGALMFDQELLPHEEFYSVWEDEEGKKPPKVIFSPTKLMAFLAARGFYRYREMAAKNEETTFSFIRVEDNTVVKVPDFDIRDFVLEFLDDEEDRRLFVRDYFRTTQETTIGKKTFSLLPFREPTVLQDTRDTKYMTFKTPESNNVAVWDITKDEVKVRSLGGTDTCVWRRSLIDAAPVYVGPLFKIEAITADRVAGMDNSDPFKEVYADYLTQKRYTIEITPEGEKTEFLKFLRNSSNFHWRVYQEAFAPKFAEFKRADITAKDEDITAKTHEFLKLPGNNPYSPWQEFETQQHLIAKITAIGHLTRKYKDPSCDQWIYAMEGELIEDDMSEGRSGKSLIPEILKKAYQVVTVDGTKDLDKDIYAWAGVTPQTNFINIDDMRKGRVKIDRFYSRQKGDFGVRDMNKAEYFIPYKDAPVAYASSNFNMLSNDGSTRARWSKILFSDHYNEERQVQDLHEHLFWYDWDEMEMSRFYTLMANCNRANYQCGLQEGPSAMAEMRRWESEIGKPFKNWADATFLFPSNNEGIALRTAVQIKKFVALGTENQAGENRAEPWSFYGANPEQKMYVKETQFKKKLWLWALLRGYIINPKQPKPIKSLKEYQGLEHGGDLKVGGIEYFELFEPGQLKSEKKNDLPF